MPVRVGPPDGRGRVTSTLPARIRAGELQRFAVEISPGRSLQAGARIALLRNWPSDWGVPQGTQPDAENYLGVSASPDTAIDWRSSRNADWHPYDHELALTLREPLPADGVVRLGFGDGASPGLAAQTFLEAPCRMKIFVRDAGETEWTAIGEVRTTVIGSRPSRLVATCPTRAVPGETVRIHVRIEDEWGNPASDVETGISVTGTAGSARLASASGSVACLEHGISGCGTIRLEVRAPELGLAATTNPMEVKADPDSVYWGDIHAQSSIGCGAQSLVDYFTFARDFAAIDFASHQGNCFLISREEWAETERVTSDLNASGRYVTLLGYEWSGATDVGGDHNVYFPAETGEIRRCGHFFLDDKSDADLDLPHVTDLHAHLRNVDSLVAVHVGGRTSNLAWHEPAVEKLVEIHSTHATSEWIVHEALRRGYRFGITGGSDGVDGRPGASHPGRMSVRNLRGGLVAVRMPYLSRSNLWEALHARRTYATTGERIWLDFALGDHRYGDECVVTGPLDFAMEIAGTAPLRSVQLFDGEDCIFTAPIVAEDPAPGPEIAIMWRGAEKPGNWQQARMVWDGHVGVTGASVLAARDLVRDTIAEGITSWDPAGVHWRSVTAGNWNGVALELDGAEDGTLAFRSAQLDEDVSLAALADGHVERHHDEPRRTVRFERLPRRPAKPDWAGTFRIDHAAAGEHAFWLRVEQVDGAMAWASPIYASVR